MSEDDGRRYEEIGRQTGMRLGRHAKRGGGRQPQFAQPVAQVDAMDGLLDVAAMAHEPVPVRQWLVPDLIPMHNVTQLSGDGGLGKTLLTLQLLVSTILGRPWLGQPVVQGRAFGVFCEDDATELHARLYEICIGYGVDFADIAENICILSRVGMANELMTYSRFGEEPPEESHLYRKIYATCLAQSPQVIVLDSSHDFFIGNENDRTQVRQFVGALRKLAIECEAAVVLNSHPSLTGMNLGTGTAGSTAWNNAVRSRLYLTVPEGTKDKRYRVLKTMKSNYAMSGGELMLSWENGIFLPTDDFGTTGQALKAMQTGEGVDMVVSAVRDLCEHETYPSPHNNHSTLYIAKLLAIRPEFYGFERKQIEDLIQQCMSQKLLVTIAAPRSRRGKFRTVIVPAGFRIPTQSDMDFQSRGHVPEVVAEDEPPPHVTDGPTEAELEAAYAEEARREAGLDGDQEDLDGDLGPASGD